MATQNDQPQPDLDAAVDAVVPSLTAVSDEAARASLRRTLMALGESSPDQQGVGSWRWNVATAVAAVVLAVAWLASGPDRASKPDQLVEAVPGSPPLVGRPILPTTVDSPAPAPEGRHISRITPSRSARGGMVSVHSSSVPMRRPDPLLALMDAVQAIPDEAWDRGVALGQSPVAVSQVPLEPIAIAPLETPPIVDAPAEFIAPGGP